MWRLVFVFLVGCCGAEKPVVNSCRLVEKPPAIPYANNAEEAAKESGVKLLISYNEKLTKEEIKALGFIIIWDDPDTKTILVCTKDWEIYSAHVAMMKRNKKIISCSMPLN